MTLQSVGWANADSTSLRVVMDGDTLYVPNDASNRHRQMVAKWEGQGNTIEPYVAPAPSPPALLPYQFFSALEISGKKPALDAFIDSLPERQRIIARSKLERSLQFRRDNDLMLAAQRALGLTDQEMDALWEQAAQI